LSKPSKVDDDNDTSPKVFSRKKKIEKVAKEKASTPRKAASREKSGRNYSLFIGIIFILLVCLMVFLLIGKTEKKKWWFC